MSRRAGKHWTQRETGSLRAQADSGLLGNQITIDGRTPDAVKQKLFDLRIHSPYRWSRKEKTLLRRQVREGLLPGTISVPGRTAVAVASQLRYRRIFFTAGQKPRTGLCGANLETAAVEQITILAKTSKAISKRLHALGLIKTTRWTEDEIQQLKQQASRGKAAPDITYSGKKQIGHIQQSQGPRSCARTL